MDWRQIPSLPALRAFESAARNGSFTAAAQELNVTHAAVAQHVRTVEAHLQTALVVRAGRGIALTDAGTQLSTALTDGFDQIIAGVGALSNDVSNRPVTLSVTPSFAENWLMPRYADFWAKHPDLPLAIQPTMDVVDLRRDGVDLAVRYGLGDWPGLTAHTFLPVDFTVVAAPALLKGRDIKSFSDLDGLPWLFERVHREARRWVMESGIDLTKSPIKEVPTFGMVMSALRAGSCLSVVASTLVQKEIADGSLVALMQQQPERLGYYIVHPKGVISPGAKTVMTWLKRQSRAAPEC